MDFKGLVEKVKEFEGFQGTAYKCPAGKLTIGYGHTKDVKPGQKISEGEATYILENELYDIYEYIKTESKGVYEFTENQLLALTDFCFNGGKGWFTQVTDHCCRDIATIAEKMLLYDKATVNGSLVKLPGLTKRRKWEYELFVGNCNEREARICFLYEGLWAAFTNKCVTIDNIDYAVCKYAYTHEIVYIPESAIQSLEIPIIFSGNTTI